MFQFIIDSYRISKKFLLKIFNFFRFHSVTNQRVIEYPSIELTENLEKKDKEEKCEIDYELFGLNKDNATLEQAKKAFYTLSLMIHPDRNQCKDKDTAKNEMIYVTENYKNIVKEIKIRNYRNKVKDSENLTELYNIEKETIFNQLNEMPSFSEIFYETRDDILKFNENWEKMYEKNDVEITDELSRYFKIHHELPRYNIIESEYRKKDITLPVRYDANPDTTDVTPLLSNDEKEKYKEKNFSLVPYLNDIQNSKSNMCDLDEAFNSENTHSGYNHFSYDSITPKVYQDVIHEYQQRESLYATS